MDVWVQDTPSQEVLDAMPFFKFTDSIGNIWSVIYVDDTAVFRCWSIHPRLFPVNPTTGSGEPGSI